MAGGISRSFNSCFDHGSIGVESESSLFYCSGTFWWLTNGGGGRKSIDGRLRLGLGQLEQPPRPDQFAFEDICFTFIHIRQSHLPLYMPVPFSPEM